MIGVREGVRQWQRHMEALPFFTCTETAKLVRKALKEAFPGVRFPVRSTVRANSASISVTYIAGPSREEVENVTKLYEGAICDADLNKSWKYAIFNGQRVHFGADLVAVNREDTVDAAQQHVPLLGR